MTIEISTALNLSAAVFAVSAGLLAVLSVTAIIRMVRRRRAKRQEENYKALVRRAGGARF